jgi:MFS family permease
LGTSTRLGDLWLLIFFVAFGVAASVAPVGTPGGVLLSGNLAPLYAATLILPPGPAALVAMLGSIDQRLPGRGMPWYRFLFNRGQFGLTYGLAALCFQGIVGLHRETCPGPVGSCFGDQLTVLSGGVIAIVIIAALNTPIVVAVVALTNRVDLRKVAYQGLQGLLLSYVGLAPLGGLVAYLVTNRTVASLGVAASISILLIIYRQLSQRSFKLQHVVEGSYVSQSRLIDKKDRSTFGHSERVGLLAEATASRLGLSVELIEQIRIGATLHDVGKIAIPDAILHKPGKLNAEEWEIMKTHCDEGYDVLKEQEVLSRAAETVRSHHENYDGSGYPRSLMGRAIPIGGRITRVVDSYDCMVSVRDYRDWVKSPYDALTEIDSLASTTYDPEVVRAFAAVLAERVTSLRNVQVGREAPPATYRETLRHPSFLKMLVGYGLSNLGDMMTTTGLALTAFASTGSILAVGAIFAARALPNLGLGLFAGPLADRRDRKGILLAMDLTRAGVVATLPFLIAQPLPVLLLITLLLSSATAVFNPTRAAALPDLIPARMLLRANAIISAVERVSEVLGYAAAAVIIFVGGIPLVFAIDALTFAVSAGLILSIPFPPPTAPKSRISLGSITRDVGDGLRQMSQHPQLRVIMPFSFFMVAAGSALLPLMVPLAVDHLNAGQPGFGLLEASIAAGAASGSLLAGVLSTVRRGAMMLAGALGMGAASILAGLSPVLPLAMIFFFAGGVANVVFVIPMITAIQEVTDKQMRGRVFAARFTLIQVGILVGTAYASLAIAQLPAGQGSSLGVVISGGLMILVGIMFSFSSALRSV